MESNKSAKGRENLRREPLTLRIPTPLSKSNFNFIEHFFQILWTNVIFVPITIYAEHTHSRYRRRINQNDYESNYIQDVPETSSAKYSSFIINADDAYTASPSPAESMTTYMTYNERQSPSSTYQQKMLSSNFKHYSPNTNLERKFTGKESRYEEENYNPNNEKEYGYILTAGGKENIYEEDIANGYKPQEFKVSYPEKFELERNGEQKPTTYTSGKKVSNYEKSFNKYRYSHSSEDNSANSDTRSQPKPNKQNYPKDTPKARSFSSELQNYPQHQQGQKYAEDFGQKTQTWKQIGPNVEISSSADNNPTYARAPEGNERPRKTYKKRKNTSMKGTRTGFSMAPQHALYVANNIQNLKPIDGMFDHGNVLKQSDKFDINDAMTNELEKEAKKAAEHKIRTKQESPKDQPYNFESPGYQNFQFYNPPLPQPIYNVPTPFQSNKIGFPMAGVGLSKGFIRYIDVEMNSSGAKKTIPALIIPLSQEQLNSPLFNPDALTAAYMNNIDLMNFKSKPVTFPYDIVNTKFNQNDVNGGLQYDNYQFQNFFPYQFKTTPNAEENYNPFLNFQNQNIIPRYNFNLNPLSPPSPPPTNVDTKPTPDASYSTQSFYQNEDQSNANLPFSIIIPNKKSNPAPSSDNARTDFKASEYYEEPNEESKYLSPSETNFFSSVTDPKENRNSSQSFEKSEARRN